MLIYKLKADPKRIPLPKRAFNNAVKGAHEDMGRFWHGAIRPKHFTSAGAREYGYAPRDGERDHVGVRGFARSYTGIKLRRRGHTRPLVWSGDSMRQSGRLDVRATNKRVRVVMNVPTLNFSPKGRPDMNMRAELTEISDSDFAKMVRVFQRSLDRRLARAKNAAS
jgi:hypothetical protein